MDVSAGERVEGGWLWEWMLSGKERDFKKRFYRISRPEEEKEAMEDAVDLKGINTEINAARQSISVSLPSSKGSQTFILAKVAHATARSSGRHPLSIAGTT